MSDTPPEIDPGLLNELEQEAPILSRLRRFAQGLDNVDWFAHLGEPPKPKLRLTASAYLDALGFPDADLAILPNWDDAASAAQTNDWSSAAWETEELARADLTTKALELISEEALSVGLQLIAQAVGEAGKAAMEEQAAYWDMDEDGPRHIAVGAAAQAAHNAGLLLLAAEADPEIDPTTHHVALKLQIFEHGRWPVALLGGSFSVF